jgi:hypothetical protein
VTPFCVPYQVPGYYHNILRRAFRKTALCTQIPESKSGGMSQVINGVKG